jgi:invasion protein IalB
MKFLLSVALAVLLAVPAMAADPKKKPASAASAEPAPAAAPGPQKIRDIDDWTVASNTESGHTICYAFTRAKSSAPALSGRTKPVLTVTHRPAAKDPSVAIDAGFAYPPHVSVTVQVDQTGLDFYTDASAPRNTFARDSKAVVAAFLKGSRAVVRSPHGKDTVTDTFSLKGFGDAYKAIVKACPAK